MHPGEIAEQSPDKIAYIMADSGEAVTFQQLEAAANQAAHLFRSLGLQRGDHIAILLENHPRFLQICWAAQRAGLYYTAISWRLQQDEVSYIVNNCEAQVFIASQARAQVARPLLESAPILRACYMLDGVIDGFESFEQALAVMPETPIADQSEGASMLYSSGTTGYPKGVKRPLPENGYGEDPGINLMGALYGAGQDSIYLSPAPLYHAAPLGFTMVCLRHGIPVVVMDHFEAEFALQCIERYRITHSQWVPTMFVRMLKLPEEIRRRYDLSRHQVAVHAAAPCPVEVKHLMMDWWGPILWEYYAGTERSGSTVISPQDWLAHPGSVGRASNGTLHICDEEGKELRVGESGQIYFEQAQRPFEYHNAPDKTSSASHPHHANWTTLGDVGYVDEEGFLYLTDRKSFMIISGNRHKEYFSQIRKHKLVF